MLQGRQNTLELGLVDTMGSALQGAKLAGFGPWEGAEFESSCSYLSLLSFVLVVVLILVLVLPCARVFGRVVSLKLSAQ